MLGQSYSNIQLSFPKLSMVQVGLLFISKTIATSDLVMQVLSVMLKAVTM